MKNFSAVSHNRAQPYFEFNMAEARLELVYFNVHSVTGNVVDTE